MTEPDVTTVFARVLVDELARHGVTDAVLAPGSRSTPVALALLADDRVRVHVRIDERSAAYLALGIAKASRRVVPVLCTSGTASSYFLGAAMEADLARVPLLLLTADRPPELRDTGASQTVDQVRMYGGVVRWATELAVTGGDEQTGAYWRSTVSRAVSAAEGAAGPAGPVHLDLPLREPLVPETGTATGLPGWAGGRADGQPWAASARPATAVSDQLADALSAARTGVVVVGDLPTPADGAAAARVAAHLGWPLLAEPQSNARHGHALRATDPVLRHPSASTDLLPDLAVVIGRVGLSRPLLDWVARIRHVLVDPDGGWVDPTRTTTGVYRCDLDALADLAAATARRSEAGALTARWHEACERAGAAIDELLDADGGLSEPLVAREVAAALPAGAALVVASSMPVRDLDLVMRARSDLLVFANRGVAGIDGVVSTVQGIALSGVAAGPVVGLVGDLSLLHDVNGLLPGPDVRPDVTYVVVDNAGGGIFSLLPQGERVPEPDFERVFGTPPGVDLAALATAYQCRHEVVDTRQRLVEALREPTTGVRLLQVRTDRAANARLHRQLREVTAAALG